MNAVVNVLGSVLWAFLIRGMRQCCEGSVREIVHVTAFVSVLVTALVMALVMVLAVVVLVVVSSVAGLESRDGIR